MIAFKLWVLVALWSKDTVFCQDLQWTSKVLFVWVFKFYYLQKLYTVCDVAMNIIMSKSTTYSLESPKDPVLPARYFTQPDKVYFGI